ncbi:expressed unknown protein [Seminavis robusta]|uniref:Uncharacterized protein n=1 Tax=Seminavis robusta TaxID=568900 RepID=A0A9N8HT16_9STRA|nr:expressed unknown protein [Seminavis robusta]|eukprot:Sro1806_g298880.1 n/a (125) ;mRNA; f:10102-10476
MNHRIINSDRRAPRWDHDTAMLASSMMLVSISEDCPSQNVGFKSRISAAPRLGSGSSLSGWGSAATRQSCKMDLCALAAAAAEQQGETPKTQPPTAMRRSSAVASDHGEGWGFYAGGDVYSRQR